MDVSLLLRVAGVGMLVAVSCQVLSKSGKDEQALLLTLTGMVVVLIMLVGQLGELIGAVREVLGSGAIFGYSLGVADYMPLVFVLAPGAFLVLGYLMVLFNKFAKK